MQRVWPPFSEFIDASYDLVDEQHQNLGGRPSDYTTADDPQLSLLTDEGLTIPNMDSNKFGLDFGFDTHDLLVNPLDLDIAPSGESSSLATAFCPPPLACTSVGATLSPLAVRPSPSPYNDRSVTALSGFNYAPATPSSQPMTAAHRTRYPCTYPGCSKSYSRHPDMRRHAASHYANATVLLCHHPGCRRGARGFLRKDKPTAHLRAIHGD